MWLSFGEMRRRCKLALWLHEQKFGGGATDAHSTLMRNLMGE